MVRVRGRVNARDKSGRITSDVKLLAESVELISDEVLDSYKPTGTKLAAPIDAPGSKRSWSSAEKVYRGNGANGSRTETPKTETVRILKEPPKDPRKERLYILIENPDDTEVLTAIRRLADIYLGVQEVVLVMKDGETKKPLRMPFKVEASEELIKKLQDLVGEECVRVA